MPPETDQAVETPPSPWSGTRTFRWLCLGAGLLLLVVYLVSVGNRYLINDDYQTLYTAWLKSQGKVAGRDYFLASYYLLTDFIAPLFRVAKETWFPVYFMRCFFIGILIWTLALLPRITRRILGEAVGWALPLVLLSTTAFLHRGLDLRPDTLTNFLWIAIIIQLLSGRALSWKSLLMVGAMLALVTLNRFKGAMILPLMGASYGYFLWKEGQGRLAKAGRILAGLFLGVLLVILPYLGWVAATDGLREFYRVNFILFSDMGKGLMSAKGVMATTFRFSLWLDLVFWGLAAAGIVLRALRWRHYSLGINLLTAGILGTALTTVVFNPAYYAYNLMTLQTLLAPFAAYGLVRAVDGIRASAQPMAPLVAGVVLLAPLLWNTPAILDVTSNSIQHQKDFQRFVLGNLRPDQTVFAMEGLGLFRPSAFHWRVPAVLLSRYRAGAWSYTRELSESRPEIIVISYRIPGWLNREDMAYIAAHYVTLTPLILVPGFDSAGKGDACTFEPLVPGEYEVLLTPTGTCTLDGSPVKAGDVRFLALGPHALSLEKARCILRRHYPAEAKALLANPEGLPYLDAPDQELPKPCVEPTLP